MKMDTEEKELLESVERGEWKSAKGGKRERARYSRYAKATFRKDRRLNIRLSTKDLEAIQKRALAEGLPYQTLISSVLHKYASVRLNELQRNGSPEVAKDVQRPQNRNELRPLGWCQLQAKLMAAYRVRLLTERNPPSRHVALLQPSGIEHLLEARDRPVMQQVRTVPHAPQ